MSDNLDLLLTNDTKELPIEHKEDNHFNIKTKQRLDDYFQSKTRLNLELTLNNSQNLIEKYFELKNTLEEMLLDTNNSQYPTENQVIHLEIESIKKIISFLYTKSLQFQASIDIDKEILTKNPKDLQTYIRLMYCYLKLSLYDNAFKIEEKIKDSFIEDERSMYKEYFLLVDSFKTRFNQEKDGKFQRKSIINTKHIRRRRCVFRYINLLLLAFTSISLIFLIFYGKKKWFAYGNI